VAALSAIGQWDYLFAHLVEEIVWSTFIALHMSHDLISRGNPASVEALIYITAKGSVSFPLSEFLSASRTKLVTG